jgi:hypothetical protein
MRGADSYTEILFTTLKLEDFVPTSYPLWPIRTWDNDALARVDAKSSAMHVADIKGGRPSIAPEKLMRAMLLQVRFSVRSELQFVAQIHCILLFRWFVGLAIEDATWNHCLDASPTWRQWQTNSQAPLNVTGVPGRGQVLHHAADHGARAACRRSESAMRGFGIQLNPTGGIRCVGQILKMLLQAAIHIVERQTGGTDRRSACPADDLGQEVKSEARVLRNERFKRRAGDQDAQTGFGRLDAGGPGAAVQAQLADVFAGAICTMRDFLVPGQTAAVHAQAAAEDDVEGFTSVAFRDEYAAFSKRSRHAQLGKFDQKAG